MRLTELFTSNLSSFSRAQSPVALTAVPAHDYRVDIYSFVVSLLDTSGTEARMCRRERMEQQRVALP